ncbi:hypothetical protein HDV00_002931 [Rhizophlyctis rosea]|nr:hypothetical protein HDV00_002931 [Rhizophlyctis rosea]
MERKWTLEERGQMDRAASNGGGRGVEPGVRRGSDDEDEEPLLGRAGGAPGRGGGWVAKIRAFLRSLSISSVRAIMTLLGSLMTVSLILLVVTFNVGLIVAVIAGLSVGAFAFGNFTAPFGSALALD